VRGGASVAGGAIGAYGAGAAGSGTIAGVAAGGANVAKEGALAAISPLRRAAAAVKERFDAGMAACAGVPSGPVPDAASGEPAWATRMRRRQTAAHGASATSHALRSGDSPSAGTSVDLSEE
jgi:type IV secretion system protein TrbL